MFFTFGKFVVIFFLFDYYLSPVLLFYKCNQAASPAFHPSLYIFQLSPVVFLVSVLHTDMFL